MLKLIVGLIVLVGAAFLCWKGWDSNHPTTL